MTQGGVPTSVNGRGRKARRRVARTRAKERAKARISKVARTRTNMALFRRHRTVVRSALHSIAKVVMIPAVESIFAE